MRLYPLPEVCALFSISPSTLRRWLRRHAIVPRVNPVDQRQRYLSQNQLVDLAVQCRRVLIGDIPSSPDACPRCAVLTEQVAKLSQQVAKLEAH